MVKGFKQLQTFVDPDDKLKTKGRINATEKGNYDKINQTTGSNQKWSLFCVL